MQCVYQRCFTVYNCHQACIYVYIWLNTCPLMRLTLRWLTRLYLVITWHSIVLVYIYSQAVRMQIKRVCIYSIQRKRCAQWSWGMPCVLDSSQILYINTRAHSSIDSICDAARISLRVVEKHSFDRGVRQRYVHTRTHTNVLLIIPSQ